MDARDALLSAFDRIYVINLPARADRRRETEAELRRLGLDFSHPKVTLFRAISFDEADDWPSKGARGCFASHLAVLRAHLARGDERALVLEDDVAFAPGLPARLPAEAEALRGDWDMIYATHSFPGSGALVSLPPGREVVQLHMIGVSRRLAERAIPYFEAIAARPPGHPDGGLMHVDGAYSWLRAACPDIDARGTTRAYAVQRPSASDIAPGKWFHRVPFWKLASRAARRLRDG